MFNQTPYNIVQTNRMPFLIGLAVLLFVIAMFIYKAHMNQKTEIFHTRARQSIDIATKAVDASWFNQEKFKNIRMNVNGSVLAKMPPRQMEEKIISNQEIELKKREIEDEYATRLEMKKIADRRRIEEKKLESEAMKSPLSIDIPPLPGSQTSFGGKKIERNDFTDELNGIIDMVKSAAGAKLPALSGLGHQSAEGTNDQIEKKAFLERIGLEDDYLKATKKSPRCPYEIKAGTYIPAALITGINSDLPGNVNAQVTGNVYDTTTGNYLLIPQGAKLVGEYNSILSFGQKRVQVVWDRIIFPDGKTIDLEKMQGVDIAGYTGFQDKVNNHYFRIYGNAVLLSMMGAGYDILNRKAEQYNDPRETVAASVGQKLADVSGQTLQKNMDVQPTLIIDPGYKFKVMVMKDMVLENINDAPGTLAYSK